MNNTDYKSEWNLGLIYGENSKEAPEELIKKKREETISAVEAFISKWKKRSDYLEDPKILKEALDDYETLMTNCGINDYENYYFYLKRDLNLSDSEIKKRYQKAEELSIELKNKTEFFELSISKIPIKKQKLFLESRYLENYKHFLERLFATSKYLLSEKEERIMNLKASSSHERWEKMVSEFLNREVGPVLNEEGKSITMSFSSLTKIMANKKKEVRDSASKLFNEILLKYVDVAETEINAILNDKKINDKIRGYSRPDKARHVSDDIDSEIVDSLIEAVTSKFKISKKFYELKSKLLGLPKLEYHERNVSFKIEKKFSFDESVNIVSDVLKSLGEDFFNIFKSFLENGQVDVFPRKGKKDGGYCINVLKSQPDFILLNHSDTIGDLRIIAHEFGHAINDELMKRKRHSLDLSNSLSIAEVASTFIENLLFDKLINETSDEEFKLGLIIEKLSEFVSSVSRQIACYNFEKELHLKFREGGYLSKKEIGKIFQKHMSAYMGDFVEQSKGSENWWVYWGHIRRFFYVYTYASGELISSALLKKYREDISFIEKIKKVYEAGSSKSPKDTFLDIGIDLTKKEFFEEGLNYYENLLNEAENLAKKLGKIKYS